VIAKSPTPQLSFVISLSFFSLIVWMNWITY